MHYQYSSFDEQRRHPEEAKGSTVSGTLPDTRGAFARDRARVLHSAALRRLADKTQVVGPRDGDTPRTRLTHSLEVAQIARGIGAGVGADPDLCELAGLCHDIGHPPYGHNGEVALNELAGDIGFEGNAQSLRILTLLEPKICDAETSFGLNLTRAALDAACKYPWTRSQAEAKNTEKYGCYDEDAHILEWIRSGNDTHLKPPIEGQVMDISDDVAYSVHDVEDGILAGRIDLKVMWDLVELAALAEKGARAFGGNPDELVEAADRLRQLDVVSRAADYDATFPSLVGLKALTSELVGRFVGAIITATRENNGEALGRHNGQLVVPPDVAAEVTLLKTIAVLYVMDEPVHLRRQDRQRERIYRVFDYLSMGAPGSLDPSFAHWYMQADSDQQRRRVIIDQIASLTESRLERLAHLAAGVSGFYG